MQHCCICNIVAFKAAIKLTDVSTKEDRLFANVDSRLRIGVELFLMRVGNRLSPYNQDIAL